MGAKEKDKELDHTIYFNKTHANAWVFLFGSQLRSAGPKTNNSSFSLLLGKQTGDEAERQQRAAPRYRTIVKSEVRKTKLPSCPAGSGTNNSSLSHPAASGTEQLFVLPAGISSRANKWCEQEAWQKLIRAALTPNKSESPSPKARLVKPDDLRDTEHTKCKRYLWAFMLSCSISIGSLWVFVASFMRFWASV